MAFNLGQMQQMVWGMFAKQAESWPVELKEALKAVEIDIVRQPGQILIVAKNNPEVEGDANIEKAKGLILDALMNPLPQVVGAFQCKVKTFK
ncbi:hypothetical protein ES707_13074 [subsurface metagenome]